MDFLLKFAYYMCAVLLSEIVHMLMHFVFTLRPKESGVGQVCSAACCHARELVAVNMDFMTVKLETHGHEWGNIYQDQEYDLLPHEFICNNLGDVCENSYYIFVTITSLLLFSKYSFRVACCVRCLNPGKYSQHLERWLSYYPPQQLHIIDGDQLRSNPVETMNELQRFLKIQPPFDYSKHLR